MEFVVHETLSITQNAFLHAVKRNVLCPGTQELLLNL